MVMRNQMMKQLSNYEFGLFSFFRENGTVEFLQVLMSEIVSINRIFGNRQILTKSVYMITFQNICLSVLKICA
jgi:Cu2+-containing amine oxidase